MKEWRLYWLQPTHFCRHDLDAYRLFAANGVRVNAQAVVIHGSPPNHSDVRRRGVATRRLGEDMEWTSKSIFGENAYAPDPGLQVGDPVECDEFPLVWTRR